MAVDLQRLLDLQERLQIESYHISPTTLSGEARAEFIRWNVLALEDELHEALNELGWKPWATSRHLNVDEYLGELVDALHFFMNLLLVVGATAADVERLYVEKRRVNAVRQVAGYDGVMTKCPNCKRELGDGGTKIEWREEVPRCDACGAILTKIEHAWSGDNLRGGPCTACGGPRLLHTMVPR